MKDFHPIVTTMYYAAIIGLSMFSDSPVFLIMSLIGATLYALYIKKEKESTDLRFVLGLIIVVLILSSLVNGLFTHNGATVLFYLGPNRITLEAFLYGLSMGLMIVTVIIWFMSFGEIMTSDKLIDVFGRLAPVIGLTISMIFRFIPLLRRRYKDIRMGQISLGRTEIKGPINKIKQKVKEMSILISWSLEASIENADSMAARGYGLPGRTSYRVFRFENRDLVMTIIIVFLSLCSALTLIKGGWRYYYYPEFRFAGNTLDPISIMGIIAFFTLVFLPLIRDMYGEFRWKRSA